MRNGLVKVISARTGELKRWETPRGRPLAVMENSSLVLTRAGKRLGYKANGHSVEAVSGLARYMARKNP
jgi:hypothetical protein